MRIAFLCGAGTSVSVGMPTTDDITKQVLSGDCVVGHGTGNYGLQDVSSDHDPMISGPYLARVRTLLTIAKQECDWYYTCGDFEGERDTQRDEMFWKHETNYEDIYYVIDQLHAHLGSNYDNPAIEALVRYVEQHADVIPILNRRADQGQNPRQELIGLCTETRDYVRGVVCGMLERKPNQIAGLSLFRQAWEDPARPTVDVYSLNHDTSLEQFFRDVGIPFVDGFGRPENGIRYWNASHFEDLTARLRLLKLHGSVDWTKFPSDGHHCQSECVGVPTDGLDPGCAIDRAGQKYRPYFDLGVPRPVLIGTFNKLMDYAQGIFGDMHCIFERNLRHTDRLVVCGYGFGDKGINAQFLDWIASSPQRKAAVIDPNLEKGVKKTARGAVRKEWDDLVRAGKLLEKNAGIEGVGWNDLRGYLQG